MLLTLLMLLWKQEDGSGMVGGIGGGCVFGETLAAIRMQGGSSAACRVRVHNSAGEIAARLTIQSAIEDVWMGGRGERAK